MWIYDTQAQMAHNIGEIGHQLWLEGATLFYGVHLPSQVSATNPMARAIRTYESNKLAAIALKSIMDQLHDCPVARI